MDKKAEHENSFFQLNLLLQSVVSFALNNQYQTPCPACDMVTEFEEEMLQLFVFDECHKTLPEQSTRKQVESILGLYVVTQNALLDLLYCSPVPADAEHWFDYQREYEARMQQINSLTQLTHWHRWFYQKLLAEFPHLPVPSPVVFDTENADEKKEEPPRTGSSPNMVF